MDFALAPANEPEREVAQAMFARQPLRHGQVLVTDKGFASAEFEALVASMGATLVRPDRKNEQPRFGNLGGVRQWVEAIIATLKGQLDLEGIYTKLGSNRLLPPLIAANAPPAPLELRRALRVIDHSIDDAIHRARMKVAA